MSFLGKVFSGKKEEKRLDTATAITQLRDTENMLLKKQEYLEKKVEQELNIAKTNAAKNKRVALSALKRKKHYEKQLQQLDGTLATIEMQRETLESASTNTAVFESMKIAADTLKKTHKHMDIDQVHDMMDEIGEQQEIAQGISDVISNPVAFEQDVDEDDLEAELENLQQEILDGELLEAGPSSVNDLPAAIDILPEKVPKKSRKEENDDHHMKDLEMWAS